MSLAQGFAEGYAGIPDELNRNNRVDSFGARSAS